MINLIDANLKETENEDPCYWSDDWKMVINIVYSPLKRYCRICKVDDDINHDMRDSLITDDYVKSCRLSLDNPKDYIDGVGNNWILTDEELNNIIQILNSPCWSDPNISVLDYMKNLYESEIQYFI